MKRTILVLTVATVAAACGSSGDPEEGAVESPARASAASASAPSVTEAPEPSPSPVSPIPDGRYVTTVRDPQDTFFEEAPARVELELDHGEYALRENGIQFESGVYWGSGRHLELDAAVGPCSGAESFHEYDWSLRGGVLRFDAEGGQICIGRLILFTRYEWRAAED